MFTAGSAGVSQIYSTADGKVDFIEYIANGTGAQQESCLAYVHSGMGYPALYPVRPIEYSGKAKAVLMDLDGTSVHSEAFWMYIIERTMAALMENSSFKLEACDEPFVSGHSVSEHLMYCIEKYCPDKTVEAARIHYNNVTAFEMDEIMHGRGKEAVDEHECRLASAFEVHQVDTRFAMQAEAELGLAVRHPVVAADAGQRAGGE